MTQMYDMAMHEVQIDRANVLIALFMKVARIKMEYIFQHLSNLLFGIL